MIGELIAHYQVLRKVGGGGMGVVYEAEDTKLGRRVALKFLPPETDRDTAALERFLREARAASALNHPGICTIYAIEEYQGRTFIAMELLEGQSLDKLLASAPLPISRVIEIGIQLADALDVAHKKGIIHRDIKPANIFVTERGPVKILDFGLAKLLGNTDGSIGGETLGDTTHLLTSPGTAVGTIAYMSPEQARGEELDGRSDLFSLGAVLYQMVTGKHPFPGSTSAVIFDNILHNAPVAPVLLNRDVPAELERILNKALEKDRDIRYQVAAELRADLKRLQREIDSGRTAAASSSPRISAAIPAAPSSPAVAAAPPSGPKRLVRSSTNKKIGGVAGGLADYFNVDPTIMRIIWFLLFVFAGVGIFVYPILWIALPSAPTGQEAAAAQLVTPAHTKSSGSVIVQAAKENKIGTGVIVAIVLVVLAAAVFGAYSLLERTSRVPFEHFTIENLTNNGHVLLAALSPDGKYLLHVRDEEGLQSLWLRHIPTGSNTQVVAPARARYFGLSFSPDASYIYCVRHDESERTFNSLYRAPVLGGAQQLLIKDVDSPVTFSPDGQRLAFLRQRHDSPFWDLLVAHSDGSPDRPLFSNTRVISDSNVAAWSPDGKTVIIPVTQPTPDTLTGLLAVDAGSGTRMTVALRDDQVFLYPAWMPDSSGVVMVSEGEDNWFNNQLFFLSYPDWDLRPITNDTNNYAWPTIASDGRTLAATQRKSIYRVSLASVQSPDNLHEISLSSDLLVSAWDWMPDGRLVFPQGGDIRILSPSGGETVILSDKKHVSNSLAVCAAGRYVVYRQFGKNNKTSENLWRMDANGSNPTQLTFGRNEAAPQCSADEKWVYYVDVADNFLPKRVPVTGGSPETVFDSSMGGAALSPDGKLLAEFDARESDHRLFLKLVSVETKKATTQDADQRGTWPIQFSRDSQAIIYTVREKGVDNLWIQPLDGSPYRQITHFVTEQIRQFAYSPDGKEIAFERGHPEADAVLIRDTSK